MILLHAMKQLWGHVLPKHFNSFSRGRKIVSSSTQYTKAIARVFIVRYYSLAIEISSRGQESSGGSVKILEEKSKRGKRRGPELEIEKNLK